MGHKTISDGQEGGQEEWGGGHDALATGAR